MFTLVNDITFFLLFIYPIISFMKQYRGNFFFTVMWVTQKSG